MSTTNLRRSSRIKAQAEEVEIIGVFKRDNQNTQPTRSRKSSASVSNTEVKPSTRHGKDTDTVPRKSNFNIEEDATVSVLKEELEKELEIIEEVKEKPSELFANKDISGERMYGFSTPVKKDAMTRKAILSRTISSTQKKLAKNPHVLPKVKVLLEKIDLSSDTLLKSDKKRITSTTNYSSFHVRTRYKPDSGTSESESVSDESEYVPSDSENVNANSESSESSDSNMLSDKSDEENISNNFDRKSRSLKKKPLLDSPESNASNKRTSKRKATFVCKDFHMKTDDYFESQSQKVVTSNNTLGKLGRSRLTEEKLQQLLANQDHIKDIHKRKIQSLSENCTNSYEMWDFILRQGYNVLLYGLGSKRSIINDFHKDIISDHPTLIINGFFPSLTVKEIVDGIIVDLLEKESPANLSDCVNLISNTLEENPDDHLYLLIHNIDGVMLRSNKTQDILSRLASIPNLHLLASIDHINAPLMWDHVKRSRYNFCWWDASTFLPYEAETSYENSLLVQQSGALALSSLHNVFCSLTSNAKAIYKILVNYQLDNKQNNNFLGMAFKDLYRAAREGFLVSSDSALRAQLTEFIDHKLVRSKRQIDGAEYLMIPLNNALLKQFLEENGS